MLAAIVEGVVSRTCNSEMLLVFSMTILQKTPGVFRARDIRKRLERRMDAWEAGKYNMLVQDTERDMQAYLSSKQKGTTPAQRLSIYHRLVLQGKLRQAVRYLTDREKGSILMPDDIDEKTGDSVTTVLESKHPDARVPDVSFFQSYPNTPDFVDLDITEDSVEKVAGRLSGSAGLGGSDAYACSHWLLKFGTASRKLRVALAGLSAWMANGFPPWAAYRALMAGRLLALDKSPGVRPIGVGETWRRCIAKCVLLVSGNEAKESCGIDQLCAGLESGVEGGIHALQHVWDQHHMEEFWGFLLIDARNAFNELNRTLMLWTVRHEWPSGARFTFNCYKHWSILVIRGNNGTAAFLFSKEGVTQGDPISMVVYGLAVLPLIRRLKQEFPEVEQPWYADDAGAAGNFDAIRRHFTKLQEIGPNYGYFPELSKSVLVVSQCNFEAAKLAFADLGFEVTTGHRYLGGFIADKDALTAWIQGKTHTWAEAVKELASAAKNYPQTAYSGLQRSLQHEWQFVQRVVSDIGDQFAEVENAISHTFLPALFDEVIPDDDPRLKLACLPVKHAGLALPDPTASAQTNFDASILVCSHLLAAIRGVDKFRTADHKAVIHGVKAELKSRNQAKYEKELTSIVANFSCDDRRTILRGKDTGQWLSAVPSLVNGTELARQEFRDALLLRLALSPRDLESHCDGCGAKFSVRHGLACKHGGLVISRHNEIRDELSDLASKAFTPSAVRDEPKIHLSRPAEKKTTLAQPNPSVMKPPSDDRGDLLIRGLWIRGTDCIIDVRVTDTDARSNLSKDPHKVLEAHEREKKKKYLAACRQQRRDFTPFVVSTDGLLGKEAKTLLRKLSALIAAKWDKPYSQVCGYVNARMSIAIVRATHLCLRGSRIPTGRMSRRPQWEGAAGLSLFRHH